MPTIKPAATCKAFTPDTADAFNTTQEQQFDELGNITPTTITQNHQQGKRMKITLPESP